MNPAISRVAALLALSLALVGCGGSSGQKDEGASMSGSAHDPLSGSTPHTVDPKGGTFAETPDAIAKGRTMFSTKCVRCHAENGAGGIGPALNDAVWLYGDQPEQIFTSIADGRPRGMPAHGGLLDAQQIWDLVAYVRSLSSTTKTDSSATH